jgi:hypothetical protein
MNASRLTVLALVFSVAMSAISLGWQVKKESPRTPFAKFVRPLHNTGISEADFLSLRVELEMLQDQMPFKHGIWVPSMITFSPNGQTATIHIPVESKTLPANFEERKIAFEMAAESASTIAYLARVYRVSEPGTPQFSKQ